MAFRMTIEDLEPGQAIELEPLFQYMVSDLAVAEKDALELCIVIASRKEKLGFPITLPAKAQNLSTEAIESIVELHNDKRPITGSWEIKKEAESAAQKGAGDKAWAPDTRKKKPGLSRQARLGSALALSVVAAIAFNAWMSATAGPPIEKIVAPADGLPCLELITNGTTAVCTMARAVFLAMPKETLGAKATITRSALRTLGVTTIWVKTAENNKVVFVR